VDFAMLEAEVDRLSAPAARERFRRRSLEVRETFRDRLNRMQEWLRNFLS
jgi:hypothetical protein